MSPSQWRQVEASLETREVKQLSRIDIFFKDKQEGGGGEGGGFLAVLLKIFLISLNETGEDMRVVDTAIIN